METNVVHRPIVWIRTALIFVLMALILWAVWAFLLTQDRPATIIDVSGTVLYHSHGDSQWVNAKPGMHISQGDQLFTQAPDGMVTVVFDDNNVGLQLKADTLATFTASWNALLETGGGGLYIEHGVVLAETRHDRPSPETRFFIETETAIAMIEGSRLVVQALKGVPTTRISALEGEIHVQAASDQASIIRTDSQPIQERETVLTAAETVIVYIEQQVPVTTEFDHNVGRVLDAETLEGVAGVVVQVAGAPELFALTDDNGYFVIPGGRVYDDLVIIGTTEGVTGNLKIQPFVSRVTDRVVDASTSMGIAQATVIPVEHPELEAGTASDGTFTIEGLPVGSHSLIVVADGYLSPVVEATVTRGGETIINDIQLLPIQLLDETRFLPIIYKNFTQYP